MDLSQAAFGLDMREGSRIYFINPVLNPQVEAQAIGRVRRINQQKPVSVETLVLKNSIDEVILERKQHMTQAEHRQAKSILDIRPIYNWIKSARVMPMSQLSEDNSSQMAQLRTPLPVFGRGFGRSLHPDDGLIIGEPPGHPDNSPSRVLGSVKANMSKRPHESGPGSDAEGSDPLESREVASRPARRIRFAV